MAFGFGFNKQKVMSAAEKYVQQGKVQNAITEYEKVLKSDPKDLTVANTVGDLYSRLGEVDKATECFKSVGDAYASQGFTVKAIAMYKKISKLKPSLEGVLKLAELYTQQGLFNDARAQYLQVADEFLKVGELENAVRIFQKILEMDPENVNMRVRLAEVYVRLGKKNEAWQIFSAAAETLRAKGSLPAVDELLQRMLTLDPGSSYALQLQARNQLESGDVEAAIATLLKVSDLDTNPDGLRDLLKAYLATGRLSDAGTVANKLLAVHNDLASVSTFAEALMQAGQYENALQVYDQHAERLLAENSDRVLQSLHSIIGHVRDNPDSLEKLLALFNKAGESTHTGEVTELLAHACVQSGDLERARDLYQKLTAMEPGNALHLKNYQQMVAQLGGAAGGKLISAEEAAVIVDELEATAPAVHQHYSDPVSLAVRSALTDAELFVSYNMPAKALGPLTAALPQAPNDQRLNQRLAALHTRAGRFAEAAVCCRTLQNVYSEAGYPDEATRYGELAERYEERAVHEPASAVAQVPAQQDEIAIEEISGAEPWPSALPEMQVHAAPAETEFAVVGDTPDPPAPAEAEPTEIDLSSEWDDSITIDAEDDTPAPVEIEVGGAVGDHDVAMGHIDETIEEIRFYCEHGMPEQAAETLARLETLTRDQSKLMPIREEVQAATAKAAASAVVEAPEETAPETVAEFALEEPAAAAAPEEVAAPLEVAEEAEPEPVAEFAIEEPEVAAEPVVAAAEEKPVVAAPPAVEATATPAPEAEAAQAEVIAEAEPVPAPEPKPGVLKDLVADLESSLGDSFLPETVAHEVAPIPVPPAPAPSPAPAPVVAHAAAPVAKAEVAAKGEDSAPALGKFVADLETSLGTNFPQAAPLAEPPAPKPAPAQWPTLATAAPASAPAPAQAAAAAASAGSAASAPQVSASLAPAVTPAAQPPKPHVPPVLPGAHPPAAKPSPVAEAAGVDLAEMFGELKQDLESGVAASDEDPETHYNLGIAFREMGLLDEAIGELQKTCQAVDRGHPFPQLMQTYTWLAQCFLDKGVPEASIRWFEKALAVKSIDEDTRIALHYELATAHEAAGDKPAALKNFMEVYGRNIDHRDVAERIKALKS